MGIWSNRNDDRPRENGTGPACNAGGRGRPFGMTSSSINLKCIPAILLILGLAPVSGAVAQESAQVSNLRYELTFGTAEGVRRTPVVRMSMEAAAPGPVLVSLPAWTPGSYSVANFARYVRAFSAKQKGREIRWDKADPDTWRVFPTERGEVEITLAVVADSLDPSHSWSTRDFAFVNGTTVFPYVEGQLDLGARVVVRTELDWRVATGMTPSDSANSFTAGDYHDLVDHPFFIGKFDIDSMIVAEKWMRLATYPEGSVTGEGRRSLWTALEGSTAALARVFGEVPWRSYTVLQAAVPGFGGMSALEHSESELAVVGMEFLDAPFVKSIHAHEIAHAWNVKRLRPADLTPYTYNRPQPTPWLWMSEGITDYYADLALVRSGVIDEAEFLSMTLAKIDGVRGRPPVSLEDASLQSWIGMTDGTDDIYYDKGSLAGLALDIIIRDYSDNQRSLDNVMRELWEQTYKKGRGFTYDDFWNAVTRAAAGRAMADFERRYVDGRDPYPWDDWLKLAGWKIKTDSTSEPRLGALLAADSRGVGVTAVDPEGAGSRGGLMVGDVITRIGGTSTLDPMFGERWRNYWGVRGGSVMEVVVLRDNRTQTLRIVSEPGVVVDRYIAPDLDGSERGQRIRFEIVGGR